MFSQLVHFQNFRIDLMLEMNLYEEVSEILRNNDGFVCELGSSGWLGSQKNTNFDK